MSARQARSVARWVRDELRVPFVVVGGSAIMERYDVGSKDVDLLIAVGDWARLDNSLENRRDATPLEPASGTIRSTRVVIGSSTVDVEFISGQPFSGKRDADDFIHYVRAYRSHVVDEVPYAHPAVVFYMRLGPGIEGWELNFESIRRDLRFGVPIETLDEVVMIARHFGVDEVLSERVQWVKERLQLFHRRPD